MHSEAVPIDAEREDHGRMTSRISTVSIDAESPASIAAFWCQVLGWSVLDEDEAGVSIGSGEAGALTIDFLSVPEKKSVKNRLHVDLRADATSREAELERLFALGARRVDVGQGPDVTWVVLADPEGNEFCLLQRTVQEVLEAAS